MSLFYNIAGSSALTTEILAPSSGQTVQSVTLTNVHSTNAATVTLFIQDDPTSGTTKTYNLIYLVNLPAKSALLLNRPELFGFDDNFGLYITVGGSDTLDVIVGT